VTIGVLIADDQTLLRGGLRVIVNSAQDMTVVGEAGDGAAAVAMTRELQPDVVLMDIRMPVQDGIEATREIVDDATIGRTRVVMLTTFDLDEYVYAALRAGASGFLLKDTTPEDLVGAIRVIAAGEALLAPTVTRRLIGEFARRREPAPFAAAPEIESLTDREREVLVEIASGRSNPEIADRLHMSLSTAKTHVSHLLAKLGARDRAQLVVIAYEAGIVVPSE
jgi:DNA-binding NarL/FixJ family response regulator